jgi:hypothetical protein
LSLEPCPFCDSDSADVRVGLEYLVITPGSQHVDRGFRICRLELCDEWGCQNGVAEVVELDNQNATGILDSWRGTESSPRMGEEPAH